MDLVDEVGHGGPASEAEAHHEHPGHHECVDRVHSRPARQEEGKPLGRILHRKPKSVTHGLRAAEADMQSGI